MNDAGAAVCLAGMQTTSCMCAACLLGKINMQTGCDAAKKR